MTFVDLLPGLNATLNGISAGFIFLGWRAIRGGNVGRHWKLMVAAFVTSTLFLVFYLIRMSLTGTHTFSGPGWLKPVYLAILFSHMILAAAVVPLVLRTLYLAYRKRFQAHKRIVRWTFPIWLYVSVTGVVVYWMLYRV